MRNWLGRLCIGTAFLVSFCTGCTRHTSSEALPQYFGFYYVGADGLVEIPPDGRPSYVAAMNASIAAFKAKNRDEAVKAFKAQTDTCEKSGPEPEFVLYYDTLRPEFFHLYTFGAVPPNTGKQEIALGIAPVEKKQSMYKLVPKAPLAKGAYFLEFRNEFKSQQLDCILVN